MSKGLWRLRQRLGIWQSAAPFSPAPTADPTPLRGGKLARRCWRASGEQLGEKFFNNFTCVHTILADAGSWRVHGNHGNFGSPLRRECREAMPTASFQGPPGWSGFDPLASESTAVCEVVVLYEDDFSRERARGVCERLIRSFWEQVEFEVSWWRFRYLTDADISQAAARAATQADIVIIAAQAGHELPAPIRNWMEKWITHRTAHESVLVALLGTASGWAADRLPVCAYLRTVAQRAGMDFLAPVGQESDGSLTVALSVPGPPAHGEPGPLASPPSHWGLNE